MEYNTHRKKLLMSEYGRHVQKMVEHCLTIPDRDKRTAYAQTVIVAMGQVNPAGRETPHYKQKLWDHLHIISDYKLDVDSPYEKPVREEKEVSLQKMKYSVGNVTYRTYGAFVEKLIKKLSLMPDTPKRKEMVADLAQHMKKLYLQYNINTCDEQVLKKHFEIISQGRLVLPEDFQYRSNRDLLGVKKKNASANKQQSFKNKRKQNNR